MADKANILIIEARFYEDIADELLKGAMKALDEAGATHSKVSVPGCFEIPAALSVTLEAAASGLAPAFDGYVLLGCVIRGETSHYDIVAVQSARAVMDLSVAHGLALGNGILTVENEEQAWTRAKRSEGDKGGEAASAALALVRIARAQGR